MDRGFHFAAWEQPQLFFEEVRAGFRHFAIDLKTVARVLGAPFFDQTMLPISEICRGQDQ